MSKVVFVTGAAGLIGSAVVRRLLSQNIDVVACDVAGNNSKYDQNFRRLKWLKESVTSDSLYENLNSCNIDLVVHCAAHPGGNSLAEPARDVEVNALGSMRLFEWCARNGKPVVYLSSSVVYGNNQIGLIPETSVVNPGTIYGVCKAACESFLGMLESGYGLKWTVLRLFATYGAGHKPNLFQGIVNIMLTQLKTGNRVLVKGSLKRERDLIYVEDAVTAIMLSISNTESRGHIINIGTGVSTTIRDLIETLCRVLNRDMTQIEIVEEEGTVGDPFSNVADCSKARRLLGFEASYTLFNGLNSLIDEIGHHKRA